MDLYTVAFAAVVSLAGLIALAMVLGAAKAIATFKYETERARFQRYQAQSAVANGKKSRQKRESDDDDDDDYVDVPTPIVDFAAQLGLDLEKVMMGDPAQLQRAQQIVQVVRAQAPVGAAGQVPNTI